MTAPHTIGARNASSPKLVKQAGLTHTFTFRYFPSTSCLPSFSLNETSLTISCDIVCCRSYCGPTIFLVSASPGLRVGQVTISGQETHKPTSGLGLSLV
ncbi:hypothetical protein PoB_006890600 [Plakobranchus ocellatus]|uniref:Uncharacterized protein n=1 Tax=Plakobranchus ocellatus TaxID=259542 RepID=A0AAV4DE20_9GAST|nr:hypothetical protein PoB_006890600 [Plakobranchus ocellatus]